MKIRSGTIGKGTLPVLAAAFLCTGAQAQIVGGGYTCTASFTRSNNIVTSISNTNGTCTLPVQMAHWFDLSADLDLSGATQYTTLKCVDFSMWGTSNVAPQLITVSVFQDLSPASSATGIGTSCEGQVAGYDGSVEPGPDLGTAVLLGTEQVFIPVGVNPPNGPRLDGDFSVEFTGLQGGGILLSPDIAFFVAFGHAGEAITQFGANGGGEVGDSTGGATGGPEQTWVRPFNCSVGGACSQTGDWQKAALYYPGNLDVVMLVHLDLNDTRDPPQLPFDCRQDIAPAGGDRNVNVTDLLALLGSWGQVAPPRPIGDIAPCTTPGVDCLGDNQVNVTDLLSLLGAWGACPNLVEDCATATAVGNVTAQISEGTFPWSIEVGLIDVLVGRPSVDDVTAEILAGGVGFCGWADYTLAEGDINGTFTSTDTIWGDTFGIFMGNFNAGPGTVDPIVIGGDVWFQYTSACNGRTFISATSDCAAGVDVSDTILEVYPGDACPGDWTDVLFCDDSSLDPPGCGDFGSVDFIVLQGDKFLIRIAGWLGETGNGSLNIICVDNSECDASLPVLVSTVGIPVTGSTVNASISDPPSCPNTQATGGRWFRVIGDGNTLTASTCDTADVEIAAGLNSVFDSIISVFCGTDNELCADLTCIASGNDDSCNFHQEVSWCSTAGQEYYILIHGNPISPGPPFTSEGFFILDVTTNVTPCATALNCGVTRPVNDLCANAKVLVPGDTDPITGISIARTPIFNEGGRDSNINAATDGPAPAGCTAMVNDVWYVYTPNFTSSVVVDTCNIGAPVTFDTALEVYVADAAECPPIDATGLLVCQNNSAGCPGGSQTTAAFDVFAGQQILIRVGADGGTKEGFFTLRVTATSSLSQCAETPELEDFCPVGADIENGGSSETLLDDGDSDISNGGCNMCDTPGPQLFDTLSTVLATFPIVDDTTASTFMCGQISTYVADADLDCNGSLDGNISPKRDTDWYELNIPVVIDQHGISSLGARVSITFSSEFSASFGITEATCGATPADVVPFLASGINGGLCSESTLNATLDAGLYYVVVTSGSLSGLAVGGTHEGHDYVIELAPLRPGAFVPSPNDECATAITIDSNSTTVADNRAAGEDPNDPLTCSDGGFGNGATDGSGRGLSTFGTIWYRFVATDVTATISTCNYVSENVGNDGIDTNIVVWTDCSLNTEVGCGEDECGAPPGCGGCLSSADLTGLLVGEDYFIMMGSWWLANQGVHELKVVSP